MKFRKPIIIAIAVLFFAIIGLCIFLIIRNAALNDENTSLKAAYEELSERTVEYDEISGVYSTQGVDIVSEPSREENENAGENRGLKKVYLTFDDGPSGYTDDILDILDAHGVKGTFFVLIKEGKFADEAYKRIADEGHTLGLHSTSHKYHEIYASVEAFRDDIRTQQEYLYEMTGVWPRIYRFPGGSSNRVSPTPNRDLIACLKEEGIEYFDWNIASGDAIKGTLSVKAIVSNCTKNIDKYDECIILMHDSLDRYTTVKALDEVISIIEKRGDCEILPITDETVPIQYISIQ